MPPPSPVTKLEEHLRGEHTFWPWIKTKPPLGDLRAAVEMEKKRGNKVRVSILRRMQNEVRRIENEELLSKP